MKGIILAGGEGKRLQPLALGVPKPLVMVKDKPLINYNLELFAKHGIDQIKILVRPQDMPSFDAWHAQYTDQFPSDDIEIVAEPEPMGTFGYLFHYLRDWMGAEPVFITNGDDIKQIDLGAMLAFHNEQEAPATVALMKMEKPDDYGAVLVVENRIQDFIEKQTGMPRGLVSAGLYLLSPEAITYAEEAMIDKKKFLMFEKDLFPALAQANKLNAFVCEGVFFDCGTPERLEKAIQEI